MKHVLLLEPKVADIQKLVEKIESHPDYRVTHVSNMREARQILIEQSFQLALVPVTRNDSIIYSLRVLQRDLPIILIADNDDCTVSERQASAAWGVITQKVLLNALEELELLGKNERQIEQLFWSQSAPLPQKSRLDMEKLTKLVQNALINRNLQFVLLSKGTQIIGYHNQMGEEQLIDVAAQVHESWDTRPRTAQIQYFENSKFNTSGQQSDSLLLFTRPFQNHLITLGALPHSSIIELRQATDLIVSRMQKEYTPDSKALDALKAIPPLNTQLPKPSYAILWLTHTPFSAAQTTILEEVFQQTAQEQGCTLNHVEIRDRYVHLVATSPPYHTGSWLADLFKQESSNRFHHTEPHTPLWHDNYYVKASKRPFSEKEIDLFLQLTAVPS